MRLPPLLLVALAVTACARPRARYVVTSEPSDYTPAVRLAVHVVATDSVRVRVDSGFVVAAGLAEQGPQRAIMRALTIEALVAEHAPAGATVLDAEGRTISAYWRPLVASAPQPLVDSLVMGVPRRVGPLAFTLPLPDSAARRRHWVVFRIRGTARATGVQLADGTPLLEGDMVDAIRVYACADRTLSGHVDTRRARRQRESYLAAC